MANIFSRPGMAGLGGVAGTPEEEDLWGDAPRDDVHQSNPVVEYFRQQGDVDRGGGSPVYQHFAGDAVVPSTPAPPSSPQEPHQPSFFDEVVLKSFGDLGHALIALPRGVKDSPYYFSVAGQARAEAEIRRTVQDMIDAANPEYVPPYVKKRYPDESPEEQQKLSRLWRDQMQLTSSEERLKHMEQLKESIEGHEKFRKLFPISDREPSSIVEAITYSMGQTLPIMLGGVAASTVMAMAITYEQIFSFEYENMVKRGISEADAYNAASISAGLQAPVVGTTGMFHFTQMGKLASNIGTKMGMNKAAADALVRVSGMAGVEAIQEYVMAYPSAFGKILAENPNDSSEEIKQKFLEYIDTEEFKAEHKMSVLMGAGAGAGFGLIGMSGGAVRARMRGDVVTKPKNRDVKKARETREKIIDGYWHGEELGRGGLETEHPLAQYHVDLYNKVRADKGSLFERMKRRAERSDALKDEIVSRAEQIREERGLIEVGKKVTRELKRKKTLTEIDATPEAPAKTADPADVIVRKDGTKFKTNQGAQAVRRREGLQDTHEVVGDKESGFELRRKQEVVEVVETPESAGENLHVVLEASEAAATPDHPMNKIYSQENQAEVETALEVARGEVEKVLETGTIEEKMRVIEESQTLTQEDMQDLKDILIMEHTGKEMSPEVQSLKNELVGDLLGEVQQTVADMNSARIDSTADAVPADMIPSMLERSSARVAEQRQLYEERTWNQIISNPDTLHGFLTNEINAWIHGDDTVDVAKLKNALERLRDQTDGMYDYLGGEAQLVEFLELIDSSIELADKSSMVRDGGVTLRMGIPVDVFYPAIKDVIRKLKRLSGNVNAKSVRSMLKHVASKEDMKYLMLEDFIDMKERAGEKITREDLLEFVQANMPGISVEVRSTELWTGRRKVIIRAAEALYNSLFSVSQSYHLGDEVAAGRARELLSPHFNDSAFVERVIEHIRNDTMQELFAESPSYTTHLALKQKTGEFFGEEILVMLDDAHVMEDSRVAPFDSSHLQHHTFQRPVAFFSLANRSHDGTRYVVEDVQSELSSIKQHRRVHVDAPFKQEGWPKIIAAMHLSRAKSLGHDTIEFPTYEWMREKWANVLPENARKIYNDQLPKALKELGAEYLGDVFIPELSKQVADTGMPSTEWFAATTSSILRDARTFVLSIPEAITPRDVFEGVRAVYDSSSPVGKKELIDMIQRESIIPERLIEFLEKDKHTQVLMSGNVYLSVLIDVVGQFGLADKRKLKRQQGWPDEVISFSEDLYMKFSTLDNNLERALDAATSDREYGIIERLSEEFTHLRRHFLYLSTSDIINKIDQLNIDSQVFVENMNRLIAETLTEKKPNFRKYKLPDKEPSPNSIPLSLKMGIDPNDVWRLAKKAGRKFAGSLDAAKKVTKAYQEIRKDEKMPAIKVWEETKDVIRASFLDVTRPMKRRLVKAFGELEANKVITQIILAKGHSIRSTRFLSKAIKQIYGGLSREHRRLLDEVIFSSRMIQIGRYKGNIKDFKGLSPQDHRNFLTFLEETHNITEIEALDLFRRTELYFDKTLELLKLMKDEGLISPEEFSKMESFRWTRTELLNQIDPILGATGLTVGARKSKASNRTSGLEDLHIGNEIDTPQMNMAYVLADHTNRVMKRIHIARINRELWNTAQRNPDNSIIIPSDQIKKAPENWSAIEMLIDGKKRKVYVPPEFARWFHLDMIGTSPGVSNALRIASGSFLLRPFATGIRLAFIPVNMIRDLALLWHSAKYMETDGTWQPVYSKALPVAMAQWARDYGKVAVDALIRGRKYDDFVEAGGAFNFLATQGRMFEVPELTKRYGHDVMTAWGSAKTTAAGVQSAFGYLNETSEIITRMMAVESALRKLAGREGISIDAARSNPELYQEAVAISKDYQDFSQHGELTKAADQFLPYLNANVQVLRSYTRGWRRDWKTAAAQHGQIVLLGMVLQGLRNHYFEEDVDQDIHPHTLANNLVVFPFGKELYYEDENGAKRYPYLKLPIDGGFAVSKTVGEMTSAYITGRPVRGDVLREALQSAPSAVSISPTRIPSVTFYYQYAHDLDGFFGGRVWPGDPNIAMGARTLPGETPQFFVDVAEAMTTVLPGKEGVSPHHLHVGVKDLFAGGIWATELLGAAYNHFRGVDQTEREVILTEALTRVGPFKGVLGLTSPGAAMRELVDDSEMEIATKRWMHQGKVRELGQRMRLQEAGLAKGDPNSTRAKARRYIIRAEELTEDERNQLFDMLEFYIDAPQSQRFRQWASLRTKNVTTRARMFVEMLEGAKGGKGGDEWKEIWREVEVMPGIASDRFWNEYERIQRGEVSRTPDIPKKFQPEEVQPPIDEPALPQQN